MLLGLSVASYLGIKDHLPPYLDLSLGKEELMTGVSFASAGSGFDPLTAQFSVRVTNFNLFFLLPLDNISESHNISPVSRLT